MKVYLVVIIAFLIASCNGTGRASINGARSPSQTPTQRDQLTAAELAKPSTQRTEPVLNAYLMPIGNSTPARYTLEGTLSVPEFRMNYERSPEDAAFTASNPALFPGFSVTFFTKASYLVPVQREELIPPVKGSAWSIILSPGTTWSEPGDNGLSRASFPFVLAANNSSETHNGIATFLFDNQSVSSLYIQVTQETASWQKTNFWGQSPMQYTSGTIANREILAERFEQEMKEQIPILPWTELESQYPEVSLEVFTGRLPPEEISATGLVMDDIIYMPPCQTRFGEYPYCRAMRHGSFSLSKSMGAAIALLHLAEKYGEAVFDLKVIDYVKAPQNASLWRQVTFGDVLNMATGIGNGPDWGVAPNMMMFDEYTWQFNNFSQAKSAQEKLKVAFSYGNYAWGPGEVARYNSTTLFVLSAAMDGYLKSVDGPQADIWEMVVEEVYRPIGILYAPTMRTTEPDGSPGLPILAYGLYPTAEDLAHVTMLLQEGGKHEGQQILHAGKVAEALRQAEAFGFPTGDRTGIGDTTYLMSFWADAYKTKDGRFLLVPYMSGYGGNRLVIGPNGISTFRFTDSMNYDTAPLIHTAEDIHPFPGKGIPMNGLMLLRGIWLVPENPAFMQVVDILLVAWLLLTLAALIFFAWEVAHGRINLWGMRLFWLVVFLLSGPIGVLVYWVAYRQPLHSSKPEAALTTPKRALGSALISAVGYTLGLLVAGYLLNTFLTGSRQTIFTVLACLYGLPLAVSLLAFRLPLVSHFTRQGFLKNLGSSSLVEFLSLNLGMIVFLPISNTAYTRFPLPNPTTLNSIPAWIFYLSPMLIVLVVGLIVLFPFHAWMERYGLAHWLLPVKTRKISWWSVSILTVISLVILFVAFQITLSLTTVT